MNGRRRKDFASLLRNIERPSDNGTYMGIASSIAGDGKNINGQNFSDGEIRDLSFALPYGISSSGVNGIRIQMIKNDNQNNVAVGVIDGKRPAVRSGCITIYDKSGSRISLNGDGSITIYAKKINIQAEDTKFSGPVTFGDGMSVDIDGNITIDSNIVMNGSTSITNGVDITGGGSIDGKRIAVQGDGVTCSITTGKGKID